MDLERLQKRIAEQEIENKTNYTIDTIKKIIPAIEDLRKSVEHIPKEQSDTTLAKGITIVYSNITKALENMGIVSESHL